MVVDSAPVPLKRRRFTNFDPTEVEEVDAKLAAAREKLGREILVYQTSSSLSPTSQYDTEESDDDDDFYELTAEDYYRISAAHKEDNKILMKIQRIREAEEVAAAATTIRVRFPDDHTLETKFHPSETIQSLMGLLTKVITRPHLPFYVYTTPPKKQIRDMSQDFYSAGFAPGGAILYFAYDVPKGGGGGGGSGPFLREEIMSLKQDLLAKH